ncbi:MAG: Cys-tRNA(Pro) deacylase [Parvimonas sp.]|nr:Cys-tRNA(Pro) deacylase [Parvimonas sp.]
MDRNICFKTLVLEGSDKNHYVCVIPIDAHLDLKKASKFLKLKSIRMILQKDLEPLTGYVHGGCSPVGMKTKFKTVFDETAKNMEKFLVSAGKVRNSIIVNPIEFADFCDADFADLVVE